MAERSLVDDNSNRSPFKIMETSLESRLEYFVGKMAVWSVGQNASGFKTTGWKAKAVFFNFK